VRVRYASTEGKAVWRGCWCDNPFSHPDIPGGEWVEKDCSIQQDSRTSETLEPAAGRFVKREFMIRAAKVGDIDTRLPPTGVVDSVPS